MYPAGEGAGYAGGIVSAAVDGIRAAEAFRRCGCEPEHADARMVVFIVTPFNTEEDIRRLDKAIRRVPELCIRETDPEVFDPFGCGIPAKRMRLRQAALMETDEIPSGEAAGRIAARSICPCPPGIAAVVPGEEIGPELARRLPGWGIPTVTVVRETG